MTLTDIVLFFSKEMGSALDMPKKWGQPLTWDIMLAMVNAGGIILDYGQTTEN